MEYSFFLVSTFREVGEVTHIIFWYKKHIYNDFKRIWFNVLTVFLSSLVTVFSHPLFIKQLKCCGLVNGASDWGSNFQHYYKTCECPSESDPSCTKYSGKTIYKQVRKNSIWHSKWFCYFIHNECLYKILCCSNYNGNLDIKVPGISLGNKK